MNQHRASVSNSPTRVSAANRGGFTLLEVLVVLAVVATLSAMVAPNVFQHVSTSKIQSGRSQIEMLSAALDAYRLDNGQYPSTEQGLLALRSEPMTEPRPTGWNGPYLRKGVPLDPWGQTYGYLSPGTANPWGFDLYSLGKDGAVGGTGENADLRSW